MLLNYVRTHVGEYHLSLHPILWRGQISFASIPNPHSRPSKFIKPIVRVKTNVIEQGAEPIYLHLIRPIIKPYTGTLDAMLQLLLLVGDFVFALSTYPLHLALEWWHKRFDAWNEPLQTEQDTQGGSSDVDTSEVPTSFLDSSSGPRAKLDVDWPETATIQLPPKVTSDSPQRQLSNSVRPHNLGPRIPNVRNSEASSSTNCRKETRRQRPLPSSQKGSKVVTADSSLTVNSTKMEDIRHQRGEISSRHRICYLPRCSYIDVDVRGSSWSHLQAFRPSDRSVPSKYSFQGS